MQSPLISVIVVTYNSSSFVIETLNSIKQQTYQNIELIISDDKSKDDTVYLCQEWLDINRFRFINARIVTSDCNTGVSANCNRGVLVSNGEWIKIIAGDDCMYKDCIENYVAFMEHNSKARICQSRIQPYANYIDEKYKCPDTIRFPKIMLDNIHNVAWQQYKCLCLGNLVTAPSVIMKKDLWEQLGGFDERIPMCEDWPMWLKVTLSGEKIYFMDKYTIKYRIHSESIFGKATINLLFKRFFKIDSQVYLLYIKSFAPFYIRGVYLYDYNIRYRLDKLGFNKQNHLSRLVFSILDMPRRVAAKLIMN